MLNLEQVRQFLYHEARLLDDRQWDEWLSCYSPQVIYWMPAWGDDDQLTRDPQKEISLIYYPNREGLEDRVYRIKTERSGASTPEPRTTHIISNVELLGESDEGLEVRYSWVTWSHRYQHTDAFFGATCCTVTAKYARGKNAITLFVLLTALTLWLKFLATPQPPMVFSWPVSIKLLTVAVALGLAYAAWNVGILHGNVSLLAAASYFTPVLSSALAAILLSAALSWSFWQGAGMVCLGSLLCWYATRR